MSESPEYVFRFYSNLDFALEVLREKAIAFASVKLFNDPFDPLFGPRWHFTSHELDMYVRKVSNNTKAINHYIFDELRQHIDSLSNKYREMLYAVSTVQSTQKATPDELLMWAHYADKHQGIAFKFQVNKMFPPSVESSFFDIHYDKQQPELTMEDFGKYYLENDSAIIGEKAELCTRCKSECWAYEKEWRWAITNNNNGDIVKHPITDESIVAMYLGLRVDNQKKKIHELIKAQKNNFPNIKVYKANLAPRKYGIEFEEYQS